MSFDTPTLLPSEEEMSLFCLEHKTRPVEFIYVKQTCPTKSRLACAKCLQKFNEFDGLQDLFEVLEDPTKILSRKEPGFGIYNCLNEAYENMRSDPEQIMKDFVTSIIETVQQLQRKLKDGLEKLQQYRNLILQTKRQFCEVINHDQIQSQFQQLLKHQKDENAWVQFDEAFHAHVQQYYQQTNQELNEGIYRIKQQQENFYEPSSIQQFQQRVLQVLDKCSSQLTQIGSFKNGSSLCDSLYFYNLVHRISPKSDRFKLIYKGTRDGLNAKAFWQKCANQSHTLMICKSKADQVFGGYNPLKWDPSGGWLTDSTGGSFLFSYTKDQIYPLRTHEMAIFSRSDGGPCFGYGDELIIDSNFKSGRSNLSGGSYDVSGVEINEPKTHLMGAEESALVEMEVFQVLN